MFPRLLLLRVPLGASAAPESVQIDVVPAATPVDTHVTSAAPVAAHSISPKFQPVPDVADSDTVSAASSISEKPVVSTPAAVTVALVVAGFVIRSGIFGLEWTRRAHDACSYKAKLAGRPTHTVPEKRGY
jgi:hypothetical protein